jgi:hypothetical protein
MIDSLIISKITSSPSLPWVFAAIGFHIVNIFLGAYLGFFKRTKSLLRTHLGGYIAVVVCFLGFLIIQRLHSGLTLWEALIFLYFIIIIPLSKRWDVLLHAFLSIVGLTLLPVLVLLQL